MKKLIEISDSEDHTLYEYGDCRITVSKKRPLHMCLTAFRNGICVSPYSDEVEEAIKIFFIIDDEVLPHIKYKMFTETTIHVWEETPFTKRVVSKNNNHII